MIDPASVALGAITGVASSKTQDVLEAAQHKLHGHPEWNADIELFNLMEAWYIDWKNYIASQQGREDIYRIETIYKTGFGSPFNTFSHNRQYIEVLSGVAVTLDASTIIGPYTISIPATTWTPLGVPDDSVLVLDSSFTGNSCALYVRYTDKNPF